QRLVHADDLRPFHRYDCALTPRRRTVAPLRRRTVAPSRRRPRPAARAAASRCTAGACVSGKEYPPAPETPASAGKHRRRRQQPTGRTALEMPVWGEIPKERAALITKATGMTAPKAVLPKGGFRKMVEVLVLDPTLGLCWLDGKVHEVRLTLDEPVAQLVRELLGPRRQRFSRARAGRVGQRPRRNLALAPSPCSFSAIPRVPRLPHYLHFLPRISGELEEAIATRYLWAGRRRGCLAAGGKTLEGKAFGGTPSSLR